MIFQHTCRSNCCGLKYLSCMFFLPSANCIFYKFVQNRMKTTALGGSITYNMHKLGVEYKRLSNRVSLSFMHGFRSEGIFPFLKGITSFLKVFFSLFSNLKLCSYWSSSWLLRKKSRLKVARDFFESRYYLGRFAWRLLLFCVTPCLLTPVEYCIVSYPATLKTVEWKQHNIVFL